VNDDTVRPVRLGAELNRSENRHVRHRMFALVDRTNMTSLPNNTFYGGVNLTNPGGPLPQQGTTNMSTSGVDPRTGRAWQIQARTATQRGTLLVFDPNDPGGNEETVEVLAVDPVNNIITANFLNPNHGGGSVTIRGNPGPWTRYDPRQDAAVVPYFSIID